MLVATLFVTGLGFVMMYIWSYNRQDPGQTPLLVACLCLVMAALGQVAVRGTFRGWCLARSRHQKVQEAFKSGLTTADF